MRSSELAAEYRSASPVILELVINIKSILVASTPEDTIMENTDGCCSAGHATDDIKSILASLLPGERLAMHYEKISAREESRQHNGNVFNNSNTYNINIVLSKNAHTEPTVPVVEKVQQNTTDGPSRPCVRPSKNYYIGPEDILIAVMGPTGSGKSAFVNHLSDYQALVGDSLDSCTTDVEIYPATLHNNHRIYLMDTPGFDDSVVSDTDVLREMATWLNETYSRSIRLTGLIYLHPIHHTRMTGSSIRNIRMFQKLCGDEGLSEVILATTFWNQAQEKDAIQREQQLQTDGRFWKRMIDRGSQTVRHDDGENSAKAIVARLMGLKDSAVLALQREMVDEHKVLSNTSVGKELSTDIMAAKAKYENELRELKTELEEAKRANDTALVQELYSIKTETLSLAADSEQLLDDLLVLPHDLAYEQEGLFDSGKFVSTPQMLDHGTSDHDFALFFEPSGNCVSNQMSDDPNFAQADRRHVQPRGIRSRFLCPVPDCGKPCARSADMERHLRNVHHQSKGSFECSSLACQYKTRRKDNILQHCRRLHGQARGAETFTISEEVRGSSQNAETFDVPPYQAIEAARRVLKRPREEDSISGSDNAALVGLPLDKRSRTVNALEAQRFIEATDGNATADISCLISKEDP